MIHHAYNVLYVVRYNINEVPRSQPCEPSPRGLLKYLDDSLSPKTPAKQPESMPYSSAPGGSPEIRVRAVWIVLVSVRCFRDFQCLVVHNQS